MEDLIDLSDRATTKGAIPDYVEKFGLRSLLNILAYFEKTDLSPEDMVVCLLDKTYCD